MNDEYKKMLERFEQRCQNAKKELCGKKEKELEKRFIEKINKELTISEYDEIEYWLASVEALDNNAINDILEENKRLNNIINELEKWLDKKEKLTFNSWNKGIHEVQRKLQELKGDDKMINPKELELINLKDELQELLEDGEDNRLLRDKIKELENDLKGSDKE